jgi:hypothetical protein
MDDLNIIVSHISTREDLSEFISSLANDFRDNASLWENGELGRYLDALAAWVEGMDGFYANMNEPFPDYINWKVFGQMLLAAKYYE